MSVIDQVKPDASNRGFLRALFAAIVFMLISGAILVTGFLAWHYPQLAAGAKTKPITLTGKDFYIAIGKGDHDGDKLILEELDEEGSAVISSRKALFNASKYPVVEYKITGRTPGAAVVLYWRTVSHNQKTLFAKLHWNDGYLSAYNMSNEEEWKGAVTELGISVSGDLRKQPITIKEVTFSPWTVQSLLLTAWSEWWAFEGWTNHSINYISGSADSPIIPPVLTGNAWAGLSILLYFIWVLSKGLSINGLSIEWDHRTIVAMFLIAWLALDGKWQVNLWRQQSETKYLYAGKTLRDKHLAAPDSAIFQFAERIKQHLPTEPQRIFIAASKQISKYTRLKVLYYLLPHNIYFRDEEAGQVIGKARPDDYLILLGSIPSLSYSKKDSTLQYNLIANGSFENSKHASGYCKTCSYGDYNITKNEAHSGQYSLQQIGPPKGEYEIVLPHIFFPPGSTFTYKLWVKFEKKYEGMRTALHGRLFYNDGTVRSWVGPRAPADGRWHQLRHSIGIDSDAGVSQLSLYVGYPTGVGTSYIDDIELVGKLKADLVFSDDIGTLYLVE